MAKKRNPEIRIQVREEMLDMIMIIKQNYGQPLPSLLIPYLRKFIADTPDRYKVNPNI